MRDVMLALGALALAALAVPLLLYLTQDRLIFYPQPMTDADRERVAASAPDVDSVFLTAADGTRLHAWHVRADRPGAPLVLYFGGNAEDVSWMIRAVRAQTPNVQWLLTEYRGYGSSGGRPSERALTADAFRWYDYATERIPASRIVLFGRSLGSALAVRVAAERRAAGVIAVAPFDSLRAVARRYYPWLPVGLLLRHPFDALERAPRVDAPLLCLVAGADEIIPAEHSRRLFDAWGGSKTWVVLDGAGHNTTDDAPEFWPAIRRFLAEP